MPSKTKKIVIVGAGPGGLAAAMLLRASGYDVTVLERGSVVGGRCGAFDIDGYRFDIGPTFFLYPRVIEEVFKACGRNLWDEVPMVRVDPMYQLVFEAGGRLNASSDVATMQKEIARYCTADAERLPEYLKDNAAKLEKFRPVLENPFQSLFDYLRPEVLRSLPLLRPHLSLDKDLRRYFSDPRVRQAFSFQAKYLGMSPFRCPSLFSILAFLEYEHGVWHPVGGCNAVMRRMAEIAVEDGVDLRLSEPVTSMVFDGNRAVGVETAQGRYAADAVVVNADFAQAMRDLVPERLRRRWNNAKIESRKYSCSTFMMYLGIEGRYDDLPHHSILLADELQRNIDEIHDQKILSEAPSLYVQNASVNDDTLAPEGHSTIYVLVPVPHETDNIDWSRENGRFETFVYDRLKLLGLDDLRDRVRTKKILTPDGWRDDLNVFKGATFNLSHNLMQMLYFRPHNRFDDVPGIYLVGGGTHPGSGLPVIFESARISARLLEADLGHA
jgi:phytoene desaturase